jgi:hypothetical protein
VRAAPADVLLPSTCPGGAERGEGGDDGAADDYPAVPQHMSMLEAVQLKAERDAFKARRTLVGCGVCPLPPASGQCLG